MVLIVHLLMMSRRGRRLSAMREIDVSPTVVDPEASNGCDSDSDSDKDVDTCSSAEPEMSYSVPSRRSLRETISFDVNIIFDCLFSESEIRVTEREHGAQMVGPTEAEKDKIAKLFLSINSELLSRNLESLPTVLDRERPICGNSLNPALVKAIQEDVAHVLSEKCLDERPMNKIRPYHVNVMSLAKLPPNESAGSVYASASSSNGPPHHHEQEEWDHQHSEQQQEQGTRYQLSVSVLLPRGVSSQSVREVVREEVHDASSVWRRSAPPFYSLDPLYIRNLSATAVLQTPREGNNAVHRTQIEPMHLSEGSPPRKRENKQHREDEEIAEHREHMVEEQRSAQHEQANDGKLPKLISPKASSSAPTAAYSMDSSENEIQRDGSCSSDNDDSDEETNDSDEETADDDSDEDDEASAQDPATQAFAAEIDRGSSAQDACLVGLEVVCRLLREGGVPQAALEALQDRAEKAFRHARRKGATPIEAWRLVGESAESGDLF